MSGRSRVVDTNDRVCYPDGDFLLEVEKGNVAGHSIIHHFGSSLAVTATIQVISSSGVYRTPMSATALEIVSSSTNDATAGSGIQEVCVEGLDSTWSHVCVTCTMAGTNPVNLSTNLLRVYRVYGTKSGTYATSSAPSHNSTITVRTQGATTTWATVNTFNNFGLGQSLIGAYTIPINKVGIIYHADAHFQANKNPDLYFFKRENANDVTSPFTGVMRVDQVIQQFGDSFLEHEREFSKFVGPCDIGFMARVTTGQSVIDVRFSMLLIDQTITGGAE